ncbi:MAG: GPR endopeptidase [Acetivibrio ethanolgignens]
MWRTDLALEMRESFPEDKEEIRGVILTKEKQEEEKIEITRVEIKDEKGERAMGKPRGTYITIESELLKEKGEEAKEPMVKAVKKHLEELSGGIFGKKTLIAGLGNREMTPDALGPYVVEQLFVTRHLIQEFGESLKKKYEMESVSAIAPGVMGQTGMETCEILKGIIHETKPDLLIVVDALAARNLKRVNTTIQLTDTGISPGAGVGNNRKELNQKNLGIPVIALGVPTVVDAATIVEDRMETALKKEGYSEEEIGSFLGSLDYRGMGSFFVTPKTIDEEIRLLGDTISEALNSCFSNIYTNGSEK